MSADLSLFPEINPNIEEIIKQQNSISPEDVATEPVPEIKKNHSEIFLPIKVKNKKLKRDNDENNSVSLTIIEDDEDETPPVASMKPSPATKEVKVEKYPHLAKARQKGLEKRREKALAKKLLKQKAKELKELEKQKRREATKERNRIKARERYRRLKKLKDEEKQQTKAEDVKTFKEVAPKNMSFKTFARYMNQYEGVKKAYETKRQSKIRNSNTSTKTALKKTTIKKPKPPQFHPPNYPLAHLYNPANRTNNDYF